MFKLGLLFQEQDGIAPQMFKSVIGHGHPEFSTSRQQDAEEFFMHLVSTIDRAEVCFSHTLLIFRKEIITHLSLCLILLIKE